MFIDKHNPLNMIYGPSQRLLTLSQHKTINSFEQHVLDTNCSGILKYSYFEIYNLRDDNKNPSVLSKAF